MIKKKIYTNMYMYALESSVNIYITKRFNCDKYVHNKMSTVTENTNIMNI